MAYTGIEINLPAVQHFWNALQRPNLKFVHGDFFKCIIETFPMFSSRNTVIYLDPPYRLASRRSGRLYYDNELTDEQHEKLLNWAVLQAVPIIIQHYPDERYKEVLKGWNTFTYESATHQGKAIEQVWYNYSKPERLHQYNYLGKNNIERQRIKRQIDNVTRKISELPAVQRNAIIEKISSCSNLSE